MKWMRFSGIIAIYIAALSVLSAQTKPSNPTVPGNNPPHVPGNNPSVPGNNPPRVPGNNPSVPGNNPPHVPGNTNPSVPGNNPPNVPGNPNPSLPGNTNPSVPGSTVVPAITPIATPAPIKPVPSPGVSPR